MAIRPWALLLLALLQQAPDPLRLEESEFARRRETLSERLGGSPFALEAGTLITIGEDENTPVYDFKYLAGFHDAEGVYVQHGKKAAAFAPRVQPAPGLEVLPLEKLPEWAAENLRGQPILHTKLQPGNLDLFRKAVPEAKLVEGKLADHIARLRLVKSEPEIRLIRKASDATVAAHLATMRTLKPGLNEKEVEKGIVAAFREAGCPDIGFLPIVAAGRNGTTLHYQKNDQPVPADTLMVIDIGASIHNYVSDITRTLPTSGLFTEKQALHYDAVLDAQKAAEAVCRPGATFGDLHKAASAVFQKRGLTKWSYAHSRDRKVVHGLGHYVGMSVHDSGNYWEPFKPGVVITIEPGWYDKDEGYGIRIEDMYLITEDGFERLSAAAPRERAEIEAAMKKRDY